MTDVSDDIHVPKKLIERLLPYALVMAAAALTGGGGLMYDRVGDVESRMVSGFNQWSSEMQLLREDVSKVSNSVDLLSYRMEQQEQWKSATLKNQERIDELKDEINQLRLQLVEQGRAND